MGKQKAIAWREIRDKRERANSQVIGDGQRRWERPEKQ